ncbi:MAG: hypothetical protein A3D10_06550 [Omnitrophica WOR_2 bacterium RIFCSPHIGHO2_02_FULL_48_11]|nr:MAG: hypothetical protein A3D10_06550 [Omnitrophica WOR_2 bacterium RIFCSPHIGHO2_02_FULL_48_11]
MKITHKTWLIFIVLALFSAFAWYQFSYPFFKTIDLTVDRTKALSIAKDYLKQRDVDAPAFRTATAFVIDRRSDKYLQKTIGWEAEQKFLKEHNFELFFWRVRFFRENEKEEYLLSVSSKTGEVTGLRHVIEDTAKRSLLTRDAAHQKVLEFLQKTYHLDPQQYTLKDEFTKQYANRTDYSFTWQKNSVSIEWRGDGKKGVAKLLTGATISGEEILSFAKFNFEIPDEYDRSFEKKKSTGLNLLTFVRIVNTLLFAAAVFFLILRRNHLAMHRTKKFYIGIASVLFLVTLLSEFNHFEDILMSYDTTQPFRAFLGRHFVEAIWGIFFGTIGILMPSLAGETLRYEVFPNKKESSFLYYLQTSFLTRGVFRSIVLGYLVCVILIGLQTLAFEWGQRSIGLWVEKTWLTQFSSAYFPFLAAITLGLKASIFEEITFRLFALSWLTRVLRNTIPAVLIISLLWGYGHSGYLIFPMWFRGIEVACLGIFLSIVYLNFGIIPVIIGHYVFDVFWSSAGYLMGKTEPFYFYSSLFVIFLPLIWGGLAFFCNRSVRENTLRWTLNHHQKFNLEVLKTYLKNNTQKHNKSTEELRKEIISHGWDIAVVDQALEDLQNSGKPPGQA